MAEVRVIDENALLKEVEDWHDSLGGTMNPADWGIQNVLQSVMDSIIEAEDIDAVPVVHARWVHEQRYGDSGGWVWRCSACRRESITCIISAMKYCHACGAKMDGGASDG